MQEADDLKTRVRIGLFVVGTLLLSPVIIPIALIMHSRDERRLQAALRRTMCIVCGTLLTERALDFVEQRAPTSEQEAERSSSNLRFSRMPLPYTAICAVCGQAYRWISERGQLQPISGEVVAAYQRRIRASAEAELHDPASVIL